MGGNTVGGNTVGEGEREREENKKEEKRKVEEVERELGLVPMEGGGEAAAPIWE